jgi:type I restriction enzyme S subunit
MIPEALDQQVCSTGFCILRPTEVIDSNFLLHFVRSSSFIVSLSRLVQGALYPAVTDKQVYWQNLPLPPIAEQKRIVGILRDRLAAVEQARQATQAQLEAAQALPAAYLRQIFNSPEAQTWEKKPLGDVAQVGAGITLGRKFKDGVSTCQVHYLRVANVKDGYLDLSDITTTEATEAEIKKCLLQYGDILLTEGGDPDKLGRGTYWQNELPECIHQNHIFRVRFDLNNYAPSFISAQIGSPYGKAYFLANAKQTTGIATINQRVLKGFPLMTPPVETQKTVILELERKLKQARAVEQSLQDQLDTINALPAALLRQAFNGEL